MATMFDPELGARVRPRGRDDRISRRPVPFVPTSGVRSERALSALIEGEIIPRLMVAHPTGPGVTTAFHVIDAEEVANFVPLALEVEADELLACVERMLARGVSIETLLVDLLAPAARTLGEYWESDRCDFVDVTMALWRLQEVVHELSSRVPTRPRGRGGVRRALFAPLPGDQHGFGTLVVAELFASEGWSTERLGDTTMRELLDAIAGDWFDVVGLTVSCDCNTGALPSMIHALRAVSRNPRVRVLVGGRVFVADPALAARVGADGTARDARGAVEVADALVGEMEREAVLRG